MEQVPKTYTIYFEGQLVMRVTDQPGPLISKAAPPPRSGEKLRSHPFLSGTVYVLDHEQPLRDILDRSQSLVGFFANLETYNYEVVEEEQA